MDFVRTANAGGLLTMDGIRILLDGICDCVPPFLSTPHGVLSSLQAFWPDAIAFTHYHRDHYDARFCEDYMAATGREILVPGAASIQLGDVSITPIRTRHLGKAGCSHTSYLIEGSYRILFAGDASPLQWGSWLDSIKPDILLAPYAYVTDTAARRILEKMAPEILILLHLPNRNDEKLGIWEAVRLGCNMLPGIRIVIPELMEKISFSYISC